MTVERPADYGQLIIERNSWDDTLRILRADPRILIEPTILQEIADHPHHPAVTLTGDVIRIQATNQTAIYRIHDYDPALNAHPAEWPD